MNKKVLLFLAQGFEEYEAAVFTDVMGWSRELDREPIDLTTTGLRPEVKGKWNLKVRPELEFSEVNAADYDALAIPGGFEDAGYLEDAFDDRFQDLIRTFDKESKIIASICMGSIPLGKSGVLHNRRATTYDLAPAPRIRQLGSYGAILDESPIVIDNNIISSNGPSTGLGVAFKLLELLSSTANVEAVREQMRF